MDSVGSLLFVLIWLGLVVLAISGMWKTFVKAGQPGWACIIPIYNIIVLLKIAQKPLWWFFLILIPFVNFVILIIMNIEIAKHFGKGAGFGLGLTFLGVIFFAILGWGDAEYRPAAAMA